MSKTIDQAIDELNAEIVADEAAVIRKKETVNTLCGLAGRPAQYVVAAVEQPTETQFSFRSDEFYGEPLASSARRVLERSKSTGGGAVSLDTLFEALKAGGFAFDAKSDKFARRSLAISLSKNTATFTRLPNGDYGLRSWYKKNAPRRYGGAASSEGAVELDADDATNMSDDEITLMLANHSEAASGQGSAASEESQIEEGQDR